MSFFTKSNIVKHFNYYNYANIAFLGVITYQQYYLQKYRDLKSQTKQIELLKKQKEATIKLWSDDVNDLTKKLVQCEYKIKKK